MTRAGFARHQPCRKESTAIREARLIRATVVREPRATFSLAPGQPARPPVQTAVPGLYLAGDWIDTGLPATIESAVRAGHWAAAAVCDNLTVAHVPNVSSVGH